MPPIHEASVNNVNYKYHQPKENSEGKFKGVMYEKVDKKTGEKKFKSSSNALVTLFIKARGYTTMKESSAKDFLNAKFPKAPLSEGSILTTRKYKQAGKSIDVVSANLFQRTFEAQQTTHDCNQRLDLIKAVNNQHNGSLDVSS